MCFTLAMNTYSPSTTIVFLSEFTQRRYQQNLKCRARCQMRSETDFRAVLTATKMLRGAGRAACFRPNRASSVVLHEPDASFPGRLRRRHKLADGVEDAGDGLVVGCEFPLES